MAVNLNETVQKIKQVGSQNVRSTPMPGEDVVNGKYQIEVNENGVWSAIAIGVSKRIAEDIISQAVNRTILG